MENLVRSNGLVRPCCLPENCRPEKLNSNVAPGVSVMRCNVCGARHYSVNADAGSAFGDGKGV